jgi:hypothetical protein
MPLAALLVASAEIATNPRDALVRNPVRLSLAWYFAALWLLISLRGRWPDRPRLVAAARWCWTWAWLAFVVHVALAFQIVHQWSNARAIKHTREVSGVGEGIYVSYLFIAIWTVDVAALWLMPTRYVHRPRWVDAALHCFMLFIAFNATVVYETGLIRWAGLAGCALLMTAWLRTRNGLQGNKTVVDAPHQA